MRPLTLMSCLSLVCFALTACGPLPRGAALQSDILQNVNDPEADFAVYPVTRAFLPTVARWPAVNRPNHSWIAHSTGSAAQIIRAGDTLDVYVWDTGENSLLTTPDQRATQLPGLRVSETGMIFVPYIGRVKVSGQTPESARSVIQRKLEEVVPSVQVQLTMAEGRRNSIDLVTGVANPGNVILPDQNFTVLSAISAGGGVQDTLSNPQVRLVRAGRNYTTSLQHIADHPRADTRLRGGDKLLVIEDSRYFIALGAAGKEAQIPFNRAEISALDALALMGGLIDARADPQGILILREYPAGAVKGGSSGPDQSRAIFALNLTTSDGLFSAQKFHIQPGDLVLATESPVTDTRTILGLAGAVFGLAGAVNTVSN